MLKSAQISSLALNYIAVYRERSGHYTTNTTSAAEHINAPLLFRFFRNAFGTSSLMEHFAQNILHHTTRTQNSGNVALINIRLVTATTEQNDFCVAKCHQHDYRVHYNRQNITS